MQEEATNTMAWRGQQELTNPANLLTRQQHLEEDWIFKDLIRAIPTTGTAILFCIQHYLLANTSTCQNCNIPRSIYMYTLSSLCQRESSGSAPNVKKSLLDGDQYRRLKT